ncbi:hypothetical protein ACE1TI_21695 [Alteribacillus sp. JSM 102045]|uniref:hypothetical protein n=1 Tax=Alteribacillus sp. JSM 102045 TaxID=1562101 RepID=UPI0035C07D88
MKNIAIVFTSFVFLMVGCTQENHNNESAAMKGDYNNSNELQEEDSIKEKGKQNSKEFRGSVEEKRNFDGIHQLLVHPGNSNGPTYFAVNKKTFEQIEIGEQVVVQYNSKGVKFHSSPPQREAEEVKILTE